MQRQAMGGSTATENSEMTLLWGIVVGLGLPVLHSVDKHRACMRRC
jgi:hypothetical protein